VVEEELTSEGANRGKEEEEEAIDLEGRDRATDRRTFLESMIERKGGKGKEGGGEKVGES